MRKHQVLLSTLFILTACAQTASPTQPPSPAVSDTPALTNTPLPTVAPRSTLPPTWTPFSEGVTATEAPENTTVITPTPNPQNAQLILPTVPPEVCERFGPDLDRTSRTYKSGEDVTVYWTPAEGAEYYYVALTDEAAEVIHKDYVADTRYVFSADLFEAGRLYGWEAYPVSPLGVQMCFTRGAELFPEL